MAKLDKKFKKKSMQRFDDEEAIMSTRKAHKRARRDNHQKDDVYALIETDSALEYDMHF